MKSLISRSIQSSAPPGRRIASGVATTIRYREESSAGLMLCW
ncbi:MULTISPECIES: hypothetical protein [Bradyrhizobium]|nr:hypothetical protein [Bradyrhizobium elkanii]WLA81906.1 hypothetical protein QNJ99_42245 [Bradyrhizobium elkanii]